MANFDWNYLVINCEVNITVAILYEVMYVICALPISIFRIHLTSAATFVMAKVTVSGIHLSIADISWTMLDGVSDKSAIDYELPFFYQHICICPWSILKVVHIWTKYLDQITQIMTGICLSICNRTAQLTRTFPADFPLRARHAPWSCSALSSSRQHGLIESGSKLLFFVFYSRN